MSNEEPKAGITSMPFFRLFPSVITILGLIAGLSAIRFAYLGKWELAVAAIIIAAFIDGMDGSIARMLNATSSFGAQLDSLSDFISFGVAPALMLYMWQTSNIKGWGWALALLYCVCMAIRLARFNTQLDEENTPQWQERFFSGVPAPAGGLLSLVPMMLTFEWGEGLYTKPAFIIAYGACIALLLASHIPTFSLKKMVIKRQLISIVLIGVGSLIVAILIAPWITFPIIGLVYLLLIPVSVYSFHRRKHN